MAIYSMADRGTITTTAAAVAEFRGTSTDRLTVLEVGIFLGAATASSYGLGKAAAQGVTPTSPKVGLAEDSGNAIVATGSTAIAWGTAPTVPANYFRRFSMPATIGVGVIWSFPRGLTIAVSTSLVIWNLATNSAALDFYFVWDE